MTVPDWIPAVIAWLGVVVSFVFARRAQTSSERANAIQEDILRLHQEEAEAQRERSLVTTWRCWAEQGPRSVNQLVIENLGPAEATDVEVLVNGRAPGNHGAFLPASPPPDVMKPGSALRYRYALTFDTPPVEAVTIKWTDPSQKRQESTTKV